jgi:hypothetical protein
MPNPNPILQTVTLLGNRVFEEDMKITYGLEGHN